MNIKNRFLQSIFFSDFGDWNHKKKGGDWKLAPAGDWCVEHVATAVEIAAIAGIDEDVFDLAEITA